jgi:hypothetical protein
VSAVRYELGFYIPEDDFFIVTVVKTSNLTRRFYFPKDDIPHSHCRENLKSYTALAGWIL